MVELVHVLLSQWLNKVIKEWEFLSFFYAILDKFNSDWSLS